MIKFRTSTLQMGALLLSTGFLIAVARSGQGGDAQNLLSTKRLHDLHIRQNLQGRAFKVFVDTGDQGTADDYYRRITPMLGFTGGAPDGPPVDLDSFLSVYCAIKYKALDLESQDSSVLMAGDSGAARGTFLVTRYFAPKITDVSNQPTGPGLPPPQLGWRKLVVFTPATGSPAQLHGVKQVYLLFNFFANISDLTAQSPLDPFKETIANGIKATQHSVNNQLILIRDSGSTPAGQYRGFFLDYQPLDVNHQGKLGFSLNATFDARDPSIPHGVQAYYVPDACTQCHGQVVSNPMVNMLDTDHWYDRVQTTNDFAVLRTTNFGVVYDGGKTPDDGGASVGANYSKAFDVIRQVNTLVDAQNQESSPGAFQARATEKWLSLHQNSDAHFAPIDRGLAPLLQSDPVWSRTNPNDESLINLLNRYCYRCHGTIDYTVFDKKSVLQNSTLIPDLMDLPIAKTLHMPQDRDLTNNQDRKNIENLVRALSSGH